MTPIIVCYTCLNYYGNKKCMAFPKGIPISIIIDGEVHIKKHPVQKNDIVFESIKNEKNT